MIEGLSSISNCRYNPYAHNTYDGGNLHPLEVVFVKMKDFMLDANWPAQRAAEAYDSWMTDQVSLPARCMSRDTVCRLGRHK